MADSKTYVFGQDTNNGLMSILAPMLQQRGIDPNMLLAMQNQNGFGGNGSWFIWILFIFLIFGWGHNGFGNNGNGEYGNAGLANLINNDNGREMLMQAIQGNGSRIGDLANMIGCKIGDVQQAINALMGQIQQVGNQVGQSSMQIINAIQAGNCQIAQQIASCCCENRLAICEQTNTLQQAINGVTVGQERGFAQIGYNTAQQTCEIRDAIRENTAQVLAGQRAAEMRELTREIAERDRKIAEQAAAINNAQQTAIVGQMIQQATAPIAGAVAALQKDVDGVKCKMPETATIPYSPVVGIPSCVAAQYGLGFGFGINNFGAWG